jgi:hypothetical protein
MYLGESRKERSVNWEGQGMKRKELFLADASQEAILRSVESKYIVHAY